MVVSPGVSRRSLIKNLVENYGVSSIRFPLDYGELLVGMEDIGLDVIEILEPQLFSINQYPLHKVDGFGGDLSAYDAGSITLERKKPCQVKIKQKY